jgi:hypothetical protein
MNEYVTLEGFKRYQGIEADQVGQDALLRTLLERSSRVLDIETERHYNPQVATRYYEHPSDTRDLWLDGDLLEVTVLTTCNGQTVLVPGDYYPMQGRSCTPPYTHIALRDGVYYTWTGTRRQATAVTGVWGYHSNWASAWQACTTLAEALDKTSPIVKITTGPQGDWNGLPFHLEPMMLLKVGSEYLYALATNAETPSLTVVRGANGTTVDSHLLGANVYVYQPDAIAQHVTSRLAAWLWHQKDSATFVTTGYPEIGLVEVPAGMPPDIQRLLKRLRPKRW